MLFKCFVSVFSIPLFFSLFFACRFSLVHFQLFSWWLYVGSLLFVCIFIVSSIFTHTSFFTIFLPSDRFYARYFCAACIFHFRFVFVQPFHLSSLLSCFFIVMFSYLCLSSYYLLLPLILSSSLCLLFICAIWTFSVLQLLNNTFYRLFSFPFTILYPLPCYVHHKKVSSFFHSHNDQFTSSSSINLLSLKLHWLTSSKTIVSHPGHHFLLPPLPLLCLLPKPSLSRLPPRLHLPSQAPVSHHNSNWCLTYLLPCPWRPPFTFSSPKLLSPFLLIHPPQWAPPTPPHFPLSLSLLISSSSPSFLFPFLHFFSRPFLPILSSSPSFLFASLHRSFLSRPSSFIICGSLSLPFSSFSFFLRRLPSYPSYLFLPLYIFLIFSLTASSSFIAYTIFPPYYFSFLFSFVSCLSLCLSLNHFLILINYLILCSSFYQLCTSLICVSFLLVISPSTFLIFTSPLHLPISSPAVLLYFSLNISFSPNIFLFLLFISFFLWLYLNIFYALHFLFFFSFLTVMFMHIYDFYP